MRTSDRTIGFHHRGENSKRLSLDLGAYLNITAFITPLSGPEESRSR